LLLGYAKEIMTSASKTLKTSDEFSGFRALLWPIYSFEVKKFVPMGTMLFFILFNYTVLRNTKDSIIVNAPGSNAEALSFIKLYGTMPMAVLFLIIYAKLSNSWSREKLFYAITLPFLVFFAAFATIFYPNRLFLHWSEDTIKALQASYPYFRWIIAILGNWSYALFYIFSELWGSVMISLLFWQFANDITQVSQARRFYGLFGLIGNGGVVLAGYVVYYFSHIREKFSLDLDPWGITLNYLMAFIVGAGFIIMGLYWWMNRYVVSDASLCPPQPVTTEKQRQQKPSLLESCKYLIQSPYLLMIAIIVLAYGTSINLVEGIWKSQVKLCYPNENDYNAFMGQFSVVIGSLTLFFMIIGNNILRRFSWLTAAMITPIMLLVTSLIFFGFIIYNNIQASSAMIPAATMTMIVVIIGFVQNVFTKSTKYSLFDSTKEMAYIPLDQELKTKGKAVVDVIGGRLGKSSGAFIQTLLFTIFMNATFMSLVPIFAIIVVSVVVMWLMAITKISKQFNAMTQTSTILEPEQTEEPLKAKSA
jgi:ATP:ADP antiporter, AAA family